MPIRIVAIPDKDGVIRVSCGDDIIEIQVAPGASGGGGGGSGATPAPPPGNPFDQPHVYLVAPPRRGGIDVDAVMKELHRRIDSPAEPDPGSVVVRTHAADLHVLGRLVRGVAATRKSLPIGIHFDGDHE